MSEYFITITELGLSAKGSIPLDGSLLLRTLRESDSWKIKLSTTRFQARTTKTRQGWKKTSFFKEN